MLSGLTDSCWQTVYFYYQLYLSGLGKSLEVVGVIIAASIAASALFTALAPWVMRHVPRRWIIPGCVALEVLGLLLMSTPWLTLSLLGYLVFFQASVSILEPAISTYINEKIPEAQRATVLSFQTGLFSAAMIIMFPLFGHSVIQASYTTVYGWMFIALIIGSIAIWGITWTLQRFAVTPYGPNDDD